MLLGGDEMGRTQLGNNNAYCQDGPISWFDWDAADQDLISLVGELVALRREEPATRSGDHAPVRLFQQGPLGLILLPHPDRSLLVVANPTDLGARYEIPPELADQEWKVRLESTASTIDDFVDAYSVVILGTTTAPG